MILFVKTFEVKNKEPKVEIKILNTMLVEFYFKVPAFL